MNERLRKIASSSYTSILYESSHRIEDTVEELCSVFGGERRICICRELTKLHESITQLPLKEAVGFVRDGVKKGEFTLVLEGRKEYCERMKKEEEKEGEWSKQAEYVKALAKEGLSREVIQKVMKSCFGAGVEVGHDG